MPIITLTTDFGPSDSYVGAMKGVILGIAPTAQIVDISHQVPPQDVRSASYVLQGVTPYFPPGTIHVVVVDPGVGSERRPLAVRAGDAVYVGPDNGVFSFALAREGGGRRTEKGGEHTAPPPAAFHSSSSPNPLPSSILHLDNPAYWLPRVSHTFHGRDIFAPVAAHLAAGTPFEQVGTPVGDPVDLPQPVPKRTAAGSYAGEIIYVDHFGNLITNLPGDWLAGRRWHFAIAGQQIAGPSRTYAAVEPGQLVALIGSSGLLEIAVRDGSAAERLGVGTGETIAAVLRASGR